MRRIVLVLILLFVAGPLQAATKVFIHDGGSGLGAWPSGWGLRVANITQGTSKATFVTNSIAGPVTGQYFDSPTSNVVMTAVAAGAKRFFITPPLSSAVTISGTITPNVWGLESNGTCNCGLRYEVLRWSVAAGGIVSSLGISTNDGFTEWGTSASVRTSPTLTPTSTAFAVGDRIALVFYSDDANGTTEGSGRTWTIDYNGATGVDGDTYLSFTETISFSADSNNARPLAVTSRVRELTDFPLLPFYFDQWRIRQPIRQLTDQLTDSEPGNRR